MASSIAITGILSFIFGVVAENKKPGSGTGTTIGDLTYCSYPSDPSIGLGAASIVFLFVSSVLGAVSIFYPYGKKAIPAAALAKSKMLVVFGIITIVLFFVAEALLMWATILESLHRINNVHKLNHCPTAKTGLLGGAAFLALDTTLFWLICQMLTMNAREDHFDYEDEKGSYGHVLAADYTAAASHPAIKS